MRKLLILIGAVAAATPAVAQAPRTPIFDDSMDEKIARSIPSGEELEAMAPALDAMVGALMSVDVGPLLDAADPAGRRYDHGARGRTVGELARRDDPYFDERMHDTIYRSTADMGRMMQALAVAAPAMRRSMREFERSIEGAIDRYESRRPAPRRDWQDDDRDEGLIDEGEMVPGDDPGE